MCVLAVLGSQGIVVKYTAAIFFRTVNCIKLFKIPLLVVWGQKVLVMLSIVNNAHKFAESLD